MWESNKCVKVGSPYSTRLVPLSEATPEETSSSSPGSPPPAPSASAAFYPFPPPPVPTTTTCSRLLRCSRAASPPHPDRSATIRFVPGEFMAPPRRGRRSQARHPRLRRGPRLWRRLRRRLLPCLCIASELNGPDSQRDREHEGCVK